MARSRHDGIGHLRAYEASRSITRVIERKLFGTAYLLTDDDKQDIRYLAERICVCIEEEREVSYALYDALWEAREPDEVICHRLESVVGVVSWRKFKQVMDDIDWNLHAVEDRIDEAAEEARAERDEVWHDRVEELEGKIQELEEELEMYDNRIYALREALSESAAVAQDLQDTVVALEERL